MARSQRKCKLRLTPVMATPSLWPTLHTRHTRCLWATLYRQRLYRPLSSRLRLARRRTLGPNRPGLRTSSRVSQLSRRRPAHLVPVPLFPTRPPPSRTAAARRLRQHRTAPHPHRRTTCHRAPAPGPRPMWRAAHQGPGRHAAPARRQAPGGFATRGGVS